MMRAHRPGAPNSNGDHAADTTHLEAVVAPVGNARLGQVLREQRRRVAMSHRQAAARAGIARDELRAIEAGVKRPTTPTIVRLLDAYRCTVDELLPPRRRLDPEAFASMSEVELLQYFVGEIQKRRSHDDSRLREDDVHLLIRILGTDPTVVDRKLRVMTGCDRRTAGRVRRAVTLSLVASTAVRNGDKQRTTTMTGSAAAGGAATATRDSSALPMVSVTAVPYVDVRVDDDGVPVAVRTNTGKRPDYAARWFAFSSEHPHGDEVRDPDLIERVVEHAATDLTLPKQGTWQAGTWYPLLRASDRSSAAPRL